MGNELTTARNAAGLTLEQAARTLKRHVSTVHAWEHGVKPHPGMIPKVAALYRMDSRKVVEQYTAPQMH